MFKHFITLISIASAITLSACTTQLADDKELNSSNYDQTRPEITQWMGQPAILLFSKTREWRHNEGIAGADAFFAEIAWEEG